jgi:hypothetical protein
MLEYISSEPQVDSGGTDSNEGNLRHNGCYLNVPFPYSNVGYPELFKGENM